MTRFHSVADALFHPASHSSEHFPSQIHLMMITSKSIDLLEGRSLRHGIRVAAIAGTLGTLMGLSERSKIALLYAGLLHDVGLVRVVADIAVRLPKGRTEKELFSRHALLNARYRGNPHAPYDELQLSDDTIHLLKNHPQASADFIHRVYLSGEVLDIVQASHELMDGSGYPLGLSGEAIPLGARILAFADTIESVMDEVTGLSARKQAAEHFADMKANALFDPKVVEAFQILCAKDTKENEDLFFKSLFTPQIEPLLHGLFSDSVPIETQRPRLSMSGEMILNLCQAIGGLSDQLLPHSAQNHAIKTAHTAATMARHLEINNDQCGQLIMAGLFHDLGMMSVPLALLNKPDTLNKDQWSIIHDHPRWTEEILKSVPGLEIVSEWSGEHHERMNGSGYPSRRRGSEISVAGRILALADVYSALTSPRPYRTHAYEPLDAIPVIGQGRFRLYDSQLLSVLKASVLERSIPV